MLQKTGNHGGLRIAGFRRCASGWLRIDMAEKLARQAHAARLKAAHPPTEPVAGAAEHHADHPDGADEGQGVSAAPPPGFVIDPALATSLGLDEETRRALLQAFGFRSVGDPALQRWRWSGLKAADKRKHRKHKAGNKRPETKATTSTDGHPARHRAKPRKTGKPNTAKGQRPQGQQQSKGGARPPRTDRPDRPVRRGPSPNSPFAGLAALMAEARKD